MGGSTNELKGRADTLDAKADNLVTVSNTQPTSQYNKVWLPVTVGEGTSVPTWAEHQALQSSASTINTTLINEVSARGKTGAVNFIPFPYVTAAKTESGITFTPNSDGSVTVNGTATANAFFNLCQKNFGSVSFNSTQTPHDTYKAVITGSPVSGCYLVYNASNYYTYIQVNNGTTVSSAKVYPMVCYSDDPCTTYQKYALTNAELSDALSHKIHYFINQAVSVVRNGQIMRIPSSGTLSYITANTVVLKCVFERPQDIIGDITWTSNAGYITFTGSCTTAGRAQVTLGNL